MSFWKSGPDCLACPLLAGLLLCPAPVSFVHSRFVPEGEFDPIADSNLVVDYGEIVSNNMLTDSELSCDTLASETVTCPYKNRRKFNMFTGQELMRQFDFVAISYLVKLKIDNH